MEHVFNVRRSYEKYYFSIKQVRRRVKNYGFIEIEEIVRFLDFLGYQKLGVSEHAYIRSKLGECLEKNDDGSDYFIHLRQFACELDCLI